MPSTEIYSIGKLSRLIRDVLRLNDAVLTSRFDSSHSSDGYQFVYLLDPDVVEFYAYPRRWTGMNAALPSLFPDRETESNAAEDDNLPTDADSDFDREIQNSVLEATALVTSEYIFSNNFVGKDQKLYLAPDHMAEFLNYVDRIGRSIRSPFAEASKKNTNLARQLSISLAAEGAKHRDDGTSKINYVKRTRDILVQQLAGLSTDQALVPMRFDRLLKKDVLCNAQAHRAYTRDVIAPDFEMFNWFSDQIALQKAPNKKKPSPAALESDAVVLSQLHLLNANWEKGKQIFVLITRDQGLHATYRAWMKKNGDSHAIFPLRHPRQYVPILNIQDMGGAFRDAQVFAVLERATNMIVDVFSRLAGEDWSPSLEGRAISSDEVFRLLTRSPIDLKDFAANLAEQAGQLAPLWMELLQYAVAAKSDVLDDLVNAEREYWLKFAREGALREAFDSQANKFEQQISKMTISSAVLLRDELWALDVAAQKEQGGGGGADKFGRRMIPTQFAAFRSSVVAGRSLQDLVNHLPSETKRAIETLEKMDRPERLLVGGCVCLEIGAWSAATILFEKASRAISDSGMAYISENLLLREVEFFLAVSRRLSATAGDWRERYEASDIALTDLRETAINDFDAARLWSELFALSLCELVWNVDLLSESFNEAANRNFREALNSLMMLRGNQALFDEGGPAWDRIRHQATLNTFVLLFWGKVLKQESDALTALVRAELENFKPLGVAGVKPHEEIYPELARYWLEDSRKSEIAAAITSDLSPVLDRRNNQKFAFGMPPPVDRLEFEKIRLFFRQR